MNTKRSCLLLASAAALCIALGAGPSYGQGAIYLNADNTGDLWRLDTSTGAATLAGTTGTTGNTVGLAPGGPDVLLGSTYSALSRIDIPAGTHTLTASGINAEGLAFDPATETLYYAINGAFGTADPITGQRIGALEGPGSDVEGLTYHDGVVFGLDIDSTLKSYDIDSDLWSTIGSTGLPTGFNKGLAYNPSLDVLYAISGQDEFLYAIDPATAASSVIGDTGLDVARGGLAFAGVPEPTSLLLIGLGLAATPRRRAVGDRSCL